MLRLLIIAPESERRAGLAESLAQLGFAASVASYDETAMEEVACQPPDVVLVEANGQPPDSGAGELIRGLKRGRRLPVMALVPGEMLERLDGQLEADDFITSPYDVRELALRIKRLLNSARSPDSDELIRCDGLLIDLAQCEVTVAGRLVELTFKEYELLKLLAGNRGRVYTREALLNRVWGYDYYGGDRTVDVHVRRLRSKIDDTEHSFIETVRNIGYRFRRDN